MTKNIFTALTISFIFVMLAYSNPKTNNNKKEKMITIQTSLGNIKIKLYNETPIHRDNFLKLIEENFYDSILFHRVIKDFMIQTGDPNSKTASKGQQLGTGGPGYTLTAEFDTTLFHKKGALAAARQGDEVNPEKKSSGSQFYIVKGQTYTMEQLMQMEEGMNMQRKQALAYKLIQDPQNAEFTSRIRTAQSNNDQQALAALNNEFMAKLDSAYALVAPFKFTAKQKEIYSSIGGTPHLDGEYTVFGEVIEGLDILEKISIVATDSNSRPLEDIRIISIELVKK